jgi:hypothetical protein
MPYRLKEFVLDITNLFKVILKIICNPIRVLNTVVLSSLFPLWRVVKALSTLIFGGIIISTLVASKITKIEVEIGIRSGVNDVSSYSILLYTVFIERAFLDAFLIIYLILQKMKKKKIEGFNIEGLLFYYTTGYSVFRINAIMTFEKKI